MSNYLPEFPGLSREARRGRNPYEGYQRGWGIQCGDLRQQIRKDPLYREAAEVAASRSVLTEDNRFNLFLILRFFLRNVPPGHVVEFGSYRGGNAIFMAYVARQILPGLKVYALDTFAGMPSVDKTVDAHNAGDFADVDLHELRAYAAGLGLGNLEFRKGLFEDTAPAVLREAGPVALAHVDCDIRSAVAYAYEAVRHAMVDGGYIVFDDAGASSCIGAAEAVEDLVIRRDGLNAEQIYPHFVFRAPGITSPR